jgi:hypothetical protein
MNEASLAPIRTWLAAPMGHELSEALERLRRVPDVQQIAVMPDVHLSADVCIGVVVATSHLIYPQAVRGDIGCGVLAVALDLDSTALDSPRVAGEVLVESTDHWEGHLCLASIGSTIRPDGLRGSGSIRVAQSYARLLSLWTATRRRHTC